MPEYVGHDLTPHRHAVHTYILQYIDATFLMLLRTAKLYCLHKLFLLLHSHQHICLNLLVGRFEL